MPPNTATTKPNFAFSSNGWGEIREKQKGGVGRREGGGWTRCRGSCTTITIIKIKMISRALMYCTRLEHRALYSKKNKKNKIK